MSNEPDPWWVTDRPAQFRAFADTDGRTAPLYARLAAGAADDPEVLSLLDPAPALQQRTVLLLASVHHLVLADPGADLARWYPSVDPVEAGARRAADDDPYSAFRRFCLRCLPMRCSHRPHRPHHRSRSRSFLLLRRCPWAARRPRHHR